MITVMAWQPLATKLIQAFESCRLEAYPDPGTGDVPWTIGWGATGIGIRKGLVWTQQQADERFAHDLEYYGARVKRLLKAAPTTAHQYAALVSFCYNVGAESLATSTLLRKHLEGDYAGAQAEFARWNKADGKVMRGLSRRRAAEAALYGVSEA